MQFASKQLTVCYFIIILQNNGNITVIVLQLKGEMIGVILMK